MPKVGDIEIWSYGRYSDNYGMHTTAIRIKDLVLYFSYETVVAFRHPDYGLVVSENVWTTTTGKHLNWLQPDKSKRVKYDEFKQLLGEVLEKYGLNL